MFSPSLLATGARIHDRSWAGGRGRMGWTGANHRPAVPWYPGRQTGKGGSEGFFLGLLCVPVAWSPATLVFFNQPGGK